MRVFQEMPHEDLLRHSDAPSCPAGYHQVPSTGILTAARCQELVQNATQYLCHQVPVFFGWYEPFDWRTGSFPFKKAQIVLPDGTVGPYQDPEGHTYLCQKQTGQVVHDEWWVTGAKILGLAAFLGLIKSAQYHAEQAELKRALKEMLSEPEAPFYKFFNNPIEYFIYSGSASEIKYYANRLINRINRLAIPDQSIPADALIYECHRMIEDLTFSIHRARNGSVLARCVDIFVFQICGLKLSLSETVMSRVGEAKKLCFKLLNDQSLRKEIKGINALHLTTAVQKNLWAALSHSG